VVDQKLRVSDHNSTYDVIDSFQSLTTLVMPINRLHYYGLSILALGFCCVTNYSMWPEKGYLPHQNVGNKFRKDPEEVKKEQQWAAIKKEEKRQKKRERKQRQREFEARCHHRKADRDDEEEPEWIADFSRKHSERFKHAESISLAAPAPAAKTGRPRRVSFEDQQRPDAGTQRNGNGNVSNGYIPYDYIYGNGAVRTTEGTRPHGVRSPPGAAGHGQHNGGVQSPGSSNKQSVGSPPGGSNRSKHATVQSNSDTVSPPRFQSGIATPGSRTFSADAGMA
jgi:hypothetical protein